MTTVGDLYEAYRITGLDLHREAAVRIQELETRLATALQQCANGVAKLEAVDLVRQQMLKLARDGRNPTAVLMLESWAGEIGAALATDAPACPARSCYCGTPSVVHDVACPMASPERGTGGEAEPPLPDLTRLCLRWRESGFTTGGNPAWLTLRWAINQHAAPSANATNRTGEP